MQLARVVGNVVTTRKDENLAAVTLLILQPLAPDGTDAGRTLVAVDSAGAGVGERVFFVGMCAERPMPALACAWRVEDAEQAEVDQDHFMKTVCCGLTRAVETPNATHSEKGASVAARTSAVEPAKQRVCSDLGPFG